MIKKIMSILGMIKHDYKLMGHSNYYRCTKCKDIKYIPPFSDFQYQTKQLKGCRL